MGGFSEGSHFRNHKILFLFSLSFVKFKLFSSWTLRHSILLFSTTGGVVSIYGLKSVVEYEGRESG